MHLLAAISPHGFGHLAQTGAVLDVLRERLPGLRLTLRTTLPRSVLAKRIAGPFEVQEREDDFGMAQHDAFAVDVEASYRRYRAFHADWERRVGEAARELDAAAPDLVFADVPYLTLAAASAVGIPSLAMCCLNWADIFRHYCVGRADAGPILEQQMAAYNRADRFLRTCPTMPMPFLDNAVDIGPVMRVGRCRRGELAERLALAEDERVVMVALGGIRTRLSVERWPRIPGVRWLFEPDWQVRRSDAVDLDAAGMPFSDLLASCDLLVTKPGYGSFTEAAGCGLPVLYLRRPDWPEAPYLERWLAANGRCEAVSRAAVERGEFAAAVERLLDADRSRPVAPVGVSDAAGYLEAALCRR